MQLSSQGKGHPNANVSRFEQISIFVLFMMPPVEEVRQAITPPLTEGESHGRAKSSEIHRYRSCEEDGDRQ
jgi:hypothetical protein